MVVCFSALHPHHVVSIKHTIGADVGRLTEGSSLCCGVQVVSELGTADIDARLEELLIDGILYAFQEQVSDDANVMLNGFGTVVNALKVRAAAND